MQSSSLPMMVLAVLAMGLYGSMIPVGAAQSPTGAPVSARPTTHPVLSALEVGQHVTLVGVGPSWDLSLLNEGTIGSHRVVELGIDHLVLQDLVGFTRRWIPVTALRAVTWSRTDIDIPPSGVKPPAGIGPLDRPSVR